MFVTLKLKTRAHYKVRKEQLGEIGNVEMACFFHNSYCVRGCHVNWGFHVDQSNFEFFRSVL